MQSKRGVIYHSDFSAEFSQREMLSVAAVCKDQNDNALERAAKTPWMLTRQAERPATTSRDLWGISRQLMIG